MLIPYQQKVVVQRPTLMSIFLGSLQSMVLYTIVYALTGQRTADHSERV